MSEIELIEGREVLVLARTAGAIVLLSAPTFPFPAIGVADHLSERRRRREAAASPPG